MQKNTRVVRSATFAAIVGLTMTMGATGAVAPMAFAQPTDDSPIVNPTRTGELTIHKKADPTELGTPTGEPGTVTGTDLPDVGFTIYRINGITLTTNAGLAEAAGIEAGNYLTSEGMADTTKVTLHGQEQFTDPNGATSFAGLPLGAYLVVESSPAVGYDPAAPFIAFVPMTSGNPAADPETGEPGAGGTSWNYDVHAYPKNYKEGEADKTVVDSGSNVGDEVQFAVTVTARTIGPEQERTKLEIVDTLDPRLTPPAPADVTVDGFIADTDYTVAVNGQTVTITFTPGGLAKVTNGQKIVANIPAVVNGVGNGNITNTATVFENNPNTGEDDETTTNDTESKFAGIEFTKVSGVDEAGNRTALEGAEFQVYGATTENQACSDVVKDQANLQTVSGVSTFTSGANGMVTINGLHVNDFTDGIEKPNEFVKYCLVETKSPAGYELLAEPIEFELLAAEAGTLKPITAGGETGEVVNLEDTTPNLPLTGGAGIGLIAALGALLVGAGAWWAKRNASKA